MNSENCVKVIGLIDAECDYCGNGEVSICMVFPKVGQCFPMFLCSKCVFSAEKTFDAVAMRNPICQHGDCIAKATKIVSFPNSGKTFCLKHSEQSVNWYTDFMKFGLIKPYGGEHAI